MVLVCAGNICRSPVAETMARQMFADTGWSFGSAGLSATPGLAATDLAADSVRAAGLDLQAHRSGAVDRELLAGGGWLVAMTRGQAAQLRALAGRHPALAAGLRIGVLGAPGVDLLETGHSPDCEEVADPWGGDRETYEATAAQIRRLLEHWRPVLEDGPDSGGDLK